MHDSWCLFQPILELSMSNQHDEKLSSNHEQETKPGYLIQNVKINEKSLYELLSPIHWTLIVCGKEKIKINLAQLKILHVPENAYPSRYILIRPDRHIVIAEDILNVALINQHLTTQE